MSDNLQHLKNNNGILLIDKYDEIKEYLECEIFKCGCASQEPYGDESIILYERLPKEFALKAEKALIDLGYKVGIFCDISAQSVFKYTLVFAGNDDEYKEAADYVLEKDYFHFIENLQYNELKGNQIIRFYDKDNSLKGIHFTTSNQFDNAEMIALKILNQNENLAYATSDLMGDVATITRFDDMETKMRINCEIQKNKKR